MSESELAAVRVSDVRRGVGQLLEESRDIAWKLIREQGEGAAIPIARFTSIIEGIADLDRALAVIERRSGATAGR